MGEYDSGPRKLPFELRNALVFSRTVDEDDGGHLPSFFVWPDDPDEKTVVSFSLSLNEFNVLASAVDVGSDPAFGEDALRVVDLWERSRIEAAEMSCADVADCINTDDDVQENIIDMLERDEDFKGFIRDTIEEHPNGIEFPINEPIPSWVHLTYTQPDPCNLDQLWGQCVGIVSVADTMIKQFFATWSNYIDDSSVILAITRNVPLIQNLASALGLAGVTGYSSLLLASITGLYNAAADATYKQELACALFCKAQLNCYVDIQTARGVLNQRTSNVLSEFENTQGIMETLISLDLTELNAADIYMAAFFDILGCGNLVWPDVWGVDAFLGAMSAYQLGSDGWSVCDECAGPILAISTLPGWEHWSVTYQGIDSRGYEMVDIECMEDTGYPTFAVYDIHLRYFYIRAYSVIAGSFGDGPTDFAQDGTSGSSFNPTLAAYSCSALGLTPFIGNIMRLHLEPVP